MSATEMLRCTLFMILVLLPQAALAQPGGPEGAEKVDLAELGRQIQRNMRKVEEELAEAEAESAQKAGEAADQKLQELIDRLGKRGGQISSDLQKMIENMPRSGGGGGGGGSQQQQPQNSSGQQQNSPQSRDRNKPQGQQGKSDGQGKQKREQGGQQDRPEGQQQPRDQDGDGRPDGNQDSQDRGRNQSGSNQNPPEQERVNAPQLVQRWGVLPPELKQRLVDRDFKNFTPEYEAAIRAYLKRIAAPQRNAPARPSAPRRRR